jgi:Na+-transporting NADH:ubiquinone oxidoreductase subunit NqrF
MIKEIVECGLDRVVYLFYGNKTLEEAVFHEDLLALSARFENIFYIPVLENPPKGYNGAGGLITGALLKHTLGNLADKTFYLCGPQGMYDFCVSELEGLGISNRRIRREVYGAPRDIFEHPGWPQEVKAGDVFNVRVNGTKTVKAKAGDSLMAALEKGRVVVPSLCRSGECSMCRIKVMAGQVFQPAGVPVRKSDRKYGYVHACMSYPLEDVDILM